MSQSQISQSIFKMYDIRGIVGKTVDADVARSIGRAFGSEIRKQGGDSVVVARDGRLSGPELVGALSDGLRAAGVDVVDLGMVPTPVGYFAASVPLQLPSGERRVDSCMVVTGSHNPPDYNGFKMVLRGAAIYGDQIKSLLPAHRRRGLHARRRHLHRVRHLAGLPRPHRERREAGAPDEDRHRYRQRRRGRPGAEALQGARLRTRGTVHGDRRQLPEPSSGPGACRRTCRTSSAH